MSTALFDSRDRLTQKRPNSPDLPMRLERGELVVLPGTADSLCDGDDLDWLRHSEVARCDGALQFDRASGRLEGAAGLTAAARARVRTVLEEATLALTSELATVLPHYASSWRPEEVSLHTEEAATACPRGRLRLDRIHLDDDHRRDGRVLRVFANLNAIEPRVWATSHTLPMLLKHLRATCAGSAATTPWSGLVTRFFRLLERWRTPRRQHSCGGKPREEGDAVLDRLHHFLETDEQFQDRCPKRVWHFPPGAMWLAFTDVLSHAVLRGRCVLELAIFLPQECLAMPREMPAYQVSHAA